MATVLVLALLLAPPPEAAPEDSAAHVEPPAPHLDELSPSPSPSPSPDPGADERAGPVAAPETTAPEAEPTPANEPEDPYELRDFEDMPFAPTAARKSATRRNNQVLVRPFSRPVYTIAASGRFVTLLGDGGQVVQPFGFGFAAQLRIHFVAVGKSRFGVEIHAGHARAQKRREFEVLDDPEVSRIERRILLTDTDFSAGPSMQIPIGPLFLQFGGSAGVAISTLFRPQSAQTEDDEAVSATNFMLRGGLSLGVPLLNHHGLTVGAGVHHIFSPRTVSLDPSDPESVLVRPFSTWLEVLLGYQIWF